MTAPETYEQLDLFYLGRELDPTSGKESAIPLLVKNRHLTTHAAIIGMTGSGKTGLGIALLEEAAIDGIPAIVIDPKGDMGNLLLTFPDLAPTDFEPWVDPEAAARKKMTIQEWAAHTATSWQQGLTSWDQDGSRIRRLRESADFAVYSPGSSAGRMVSIVDSLAAPPADVLADQDMLTELVNVSVSSLLGLLGIEADPIKSREHVLLATILLNAWERGESLNFASLIGAVAQPPFAQIGVFPVDAFYPPNKRMELAMQFNTLVASPSFNNWMQGEPLQIENFLYTASGKPRISIFSIAHLSDGERMFFVTLLLGRLLGWMRRQEGSTGLRAMLYMDEIFGYFPPTANPPSKKPMLLLLKQARAFGLGVVLSTQNPVDLDYKGLANIGTWFVGRLQTRQDQGRVVAGMGGGSAKFDANRIRNLLAGLKERSFLLYSAHRNEPVLFTTRWVMSYLKGPISLVELARLAPGAAQPAAAEQTATTPVGASMDGTLSFSAVRPPLAGSIIQYYVPSPMPAAEQQYSASLLGLAAVRNVDQRRGIDQITEIRLQVALPQAGEGASWERAQAFPITVEQLQSEAPESVLFADLPADMKVRKNFNDEEKRLADHLYRTQLLRIFRVKELGLESAPEEAEQDFRQRIASALAAKKEAAITTLEQVYGKKQQQLQDRLQRAEARLDKEQSDVRAKGMETAISVGSAILGAFLGRKALSSTTANKSVRGVRNAGQLLKERQDVQLAQNEVSRLEQELQTMVAELQQKVQELSTGWDPALVELETVAIAPRKSDIYDVRVCLLWEPVLDFSPKEGAQLPVQSA
ncbi:MAG: ATP-binding protein [Desulfobulbaceae bacterium]|nr:ATP-binding protein [Desulfobulbaceae bacterium]